MGLVYYGSYYHSPDGNWNHVGNWYSFPGDYSDPNIPLGRLPMAGDTPVIYGYPNSFGATPSVVSTGPAGGWAGPLQMAGLSKIIAGIYSGPVSVSGQIGIGVTPQAIISGGTFSGTVTMTPTSAQNYMTISGGQVVTPVSEFFISGGTYSPVSTVHVTPSSITGIVNDPGFAANGGVFSPNYTIVGAGVAGAFLSPTQVAALYAAMNSLVTASVVELPPDSDWILRLATAASATGFSNKGAFIESMQLRPLSTLVLYATWLGAQAGTQTPSVPKTLPLPN